MPVPREDFMLFADPPADNFWPVIFIVVTCICLFVGLIVCADLHPLFPPLDPVDYHRGEIGICGPCGHDLPQGQFGRDRPQQDHGRAGGHQRPRRRHLQGPGSPLPGRRQRAAGDPALVAARKAKFDLDFKLATAIDLAGRNVLEAVQTSVYPKVIDCPSRSTGRETLDGIAQNGIQLKVKARVTVRANLKQLIGGATEETIVARVGEGIVSALGSAKSHSEVLATPDRISKTVLGRRLDAQTAFEIVSIDIGEVSVGENIGARLQADQAEADMRVARANAEGRRAMAVAEEQEYIAAIEENRAKVVQAEAEVPLAIAQAFREGMLGILDYYKLRNVQADTDMRNAIPEARRHPNGKTKDRGMNGPAPLTVRRRRGGHRGPGGDLGLRAAGPAAPGQPAAVGAETARATAAARRSRGPGRDRRVSPSRLRSSRPGTPRRGAARPAGKNRDRRSRRRSRGRAGRRRGREAGGTVPRRGRIQPPHFAARRRCRTGRRGKQSASQADVQPRREPVGQEAGRSRRPADPRRDPPAARGRRAALASLLDLLGNPDGIRQAIVINEILQRNENRWD